MGTSREQRAVETELTGRRLLADPRLNHGVGFTEEEREELGLTGLLPPGVLTVDQQAERAYAQFSRQPSDLGKSTFLSLLQNRNEILFYRLLSEHLAEMLPIVYTPTVGEVIKQYSNEYRRPLGVYLSVDHPSDLERSLLAPELGPDDVDLVVATDGEAILGIGDWGVGGVAISAAKLAVYTAAGGVDPDRALPVVLDVGTNREELLSNPLYLGNRHPRVDEATYDRFLDSYVETASRLFPHALLHWEDLGAANARRVLERHRDSVLTFNDDIQGTGAVALGALVSALQVTGSRLADQRVVVHGAGTAGIGVAEQLAAAMAAEGVEHPEERFFALSSRGLLLDSDPGLRDYQYRFARPGSEASRFEHDADGRIRLPAVVAGARPTVLIGTSGQTGAFTEEVVTTMASSCERPIVLPLSNPTALSEAQPSDVLAWTGGRALVATGSPFPPVSVETHTHVIAQANNALVFPGIGLGAIVARASRVTPGMLSAAAAAVASRIDSSALGAPLLPQVEAMRETSVAVAAAVAAAARREGVARRKSLPGDPAALEQAVREAMWQPRYRPVRLRRRG